MRQRRALVGARRLVEIEAEALARLQHHLAVLQVADAQLRSLHVGEDADRPVQLLLDFADGVVELAMIGVGAVAEVQAKDVDAGAKELADHLLAGAGGAEREIGRASGWERVCQYGEIWVVVAYLKKKT